MDALASSINYPISLPQIAAVSVETPDTRLVSQTDVGPAKVRRRYTFAPRVLSGQLVLNAQQAIEFQTFYDTTLAGGTLTFNWEDPFTDAPVEMRFKSRGKLQLFGGGHPADRKWVVDVALELLGAA